MAKDCCGEPALRSDQMLLAALAYAQRLGWPVFPCCWITETGICSCGRRDCGSPGKHPLTGQGFKEATRDEVQLRGWWSKWPAANIGIPTGAASGFDVLDVDPRHGGEEALAELELLHGKLPATVEALTGGGGRHVLFRHQEGVSNKAGFLPGLDVRGEGGYILVAPSNHHSGRRYAWELSGRPGEVELVEWPAWLVELVRQHSNGKPKGPAPVVEGSIPEGQRNTTLLSLAGTMRRRGMGEAAVLAALREENTTRCQPSLPDEEVQRIAASVARYAPAAPSGQGDGKQGTAAPPAFSTFYRIQDGCLGYMKKLGRGDDGTEIFSPLCNFTARVVEERTLDDGVEVKRRFLVEGRLAQGQPLPQAEVSAAQFAAMRWPVDLWGVRARICAGMGAVDRLREAVQVFSAEALSRFAYTHTGWRKIDGAWRYLHAGLSDTEVLLEPPLNRYALPAIPEDVAGALGQSLALLEVAPDTVTLPLLAAVYLAPLCEFLHPDFAVYLVGKTGSLKSTLAALFLSHYGAFDRTSLPASWESTDNALERRLFTLKDTLCVVDDYAPRADVYSQRKQAQRAQRIIRAMGNLSGRSRLSGDLSERPEHPPRGLLLSTGEDLPPGQSILARILSIEVDRQQLHLDRLTQAQAQAGRLPQAMAGYIEWLTPQLDELVPVLRVQWQEHRRRFTRQAAHLRIPEILAYLALGIDLLTSFARDRGALTPEQIRNLAQRTQAALLSLGEAHGQRVKEEDPAEVFLATLSAMLAQGAIWLEHKDRLGEGGNREITGWKDGEYVYLIPDAARHAVGRYLQESGSHFPHSARALYEALDGRGALVKGIDERGTVAVRIGGKRRRVLQIPLTFLEPEEDGEAE